MHTHAHTFWRSAPHHDLCSLVQQGTVAALLIFLLGRVGVPLVWKCVKNRCAVGVRVSAESWGAARMAARIAWELSWGMCA